MRAETALGGNYTEIFLSYPAEGEGLRNTGKYLMLTTIDLLVCFLRIEWRLIINITVIRLQIVDPPRCKRLGINLSKFKLLG